MITEIEERDFGIALSTFSSDSDDMVSSEGFKDMKSLFEWMKSETQKLLGISSMCNGTVVAMKMCDKFSNLDDSNIFKQIIDHGRELRIDPDIQASDPKYKAVIVISTYLDTNGLGNRLHKKD